MIHLPAPPSPFTPLHVRRHRITGIGIAVGCAVGSLVPLPRALGAQATAVAWQDTTPRPAAIAVSDWYSRRLAIHRATAYAIPPLFLGQYLVGQRLYRDVNRPGGPPDWVRPTHQVGAALIGTAFAVNATTGIWNLWTARQERQDRAIRVLHGVSMLAAAGGFTYAGVRLAEQAEHSAEKRREHRQVAAVSMGVTLLSGTMMWWVNR